LTRRKPLKKKYLKKSNNIDGGQWPGMGVEVPLKQLRLSNHQWKNQFAYQKGNKVNLLRSLPQQINNRKTLASPLRRTL